MTIERRARPLTTGRKTLLDRLQVMIIPEKLLPIGCHPLCVSRRSGCHGADRNGDDSDARRGYLPGIKGRCS